MRLFQRQVQEVRMAPSRTTTAQPWRWWITGAAAVVGAALAQMQLDSTDWTSRESRHSVTETVRRIEVAAREGGMPLFVKCPPPRAGGQPGDGTAAVDDALVLVLGTEAGHTPVVQPAPGSALQLPLTVWVHADAAAGARVRFSDPHRLADGAELPPELLRQVERLPSLIDAAITT
jgi:uncharacterized protein (DUF302 family)